VLTLTEMLRKHGVVGKFVEYCGPGLSNLALADRATIANMSLRIRRTWRLLPCRCRKSLRYLQMTGREQTSSTPVERYCRAQALAPARGHHSGPEFTDLLGLDLHTVEASLAGPRRPQDRVPIREVQHSLRNAFADEFPAARQSQGALRLGGRHG